VSSPRNFVGCNLPFDSSYLQNNRLGLSP